MTTPDGEVSKRPLGHKEGLEGRFMVPSGHGYTLANEQDNPSRLLIFFPEVQ